MKQGNPCRLHGHQNIRSSPHWP